MPSLIKRAPHALRTRRDRLWFRIKYGFDPPPPGTDLVDYRALIDLIRRKNLLALPGDITEIGVFLGGGTYTLANFLKHQMSPKKVEAIDIFDPSFDATANTNGDAMWALYARTLAGRSQFSIFSEVTQGLDNIILLVGDSRTIKPISSSLCFGFIDGNHSPDYVVNDFYLVWNRLTPGGVVAFDDYGYDLPCVTGAIDSLRETHRSEIAAFSVDSKRHVAIIERKRG